MGTITKTQARAPCPIFAGRGIETEGFTFAMPDKIYLTSTPANKASERGLLSVFCYDLAEAVYNDSDDRTAFLIYVKGGAYCDTITTGKMMHALDVLMEVDYEYTPTSADRNAYARGARLQAYGKKDMDGGIMGAYINAQLQGGYEYTGTTSVGTFAGAVGAEIRTEAMGPGTTVTVTRITTLLLWGRYMATVSGAVTMLQIEVPWQYAAVGGQVVGIEFTEGYKYSSGQTDFDIGIDFGDGLSVIAIDIGDVTTGIKFTGTATTGIDFQDETTTAIDIGACTTGISMTGSMTTGIDFATGTYSIAIDLTDIKVNGSDDDLSLIRVGGYDTANTITTALTANTFMVSINVDSQIDPTGTQWLAALYTKVEVTTADQAELSAVTCMVRADIGKPMAAFYGIQAHVKFSGTGACSSEVIGISAQIYDDGSTTSSGTGLHWGIKVDMRHAYCPTGVASSACIFAFSTVSVGSAIRIGIYGGKTMAAGITFNAAGNMTTVFNFVTNANITNLMSFATADGCLSAETGDVAAADGYKIKILVGGTAYYLRAATDWV